MVTLKCRGIELIEGLNDAAKNHLRTAVTFLGNPSGHKDITNASTDMKEPAPVNSNTPTDSTVGASSGSISGAQNSVVKLHHRGAGRGGKRASTQSNKAASQGLSAAELEVLIADLLSREPWAPSLSTAEGGGNSSAAGRGVQEVTAEEIASWLVRELGHRRYYFFPLWYINEFCTAFVQLEDLR